MRVPVSSHLWGEPGDLSTKDAWRGQSLRAVLVPDKNESDSQVSTANFCKTVPVRLEITANVQDDLVFLPIPKMLGNSKLPSMPCSTSSVWTDRYIPKVIYIFLAATNTGYPNSVAVDSLMIIAFCLYIICDNVPILLKFSSCKRGALMYAATDQNDSNFPF